MHPIGRRFRAVAPRIRGGEGVALLLLSLALVLVTLPRFNRGDALVRSWTALGRDASVLQGDASHYTAMVEAFRGRRDDTVAINAPFAYRPLVPYLASLLPMPPLTSINVINLLALEAGLLLLHRLLRRVSTKSSLRLLGITMYVFSFPVFYYGAIGYLDPVLIAALIAGSYAIVRRRWFWFALAILLGAAVKETIVLLFPVALVRLRTQRRTGSREGAFLLGLFLLFVVEVAILRTTSLAMVSGHIWYPSVERLVSNLTRWRCWASFGLTFGLPGLFALVGAIQWVRSRTLRRPEVQLPMWSGLLGALALSIYALASAYADGRFLWTMYPFAIPLAVFAIESILDRRLRTAHVPRIRSEVKYTKDLATSPYSRDL